jgi:acetyl-CoA carboxylase biotin carboxylase subunit
MNTRLQVEHPITELTTGIDLVREMVRVAAGERLGYVQADVTRRGHAMQCRIYAEDPSTGFLPSPGRIDTIRVPAGPGVRDDSCAFDGCEISSFYDPLVSKLCTWAPTRAQALDRMRRALSEYAINGIRTNLPFHLALVEHAEFAEGRYDTGFIGRNEPTLLTAGQAGDAALAMSIAAAIVAALGEEAPGGAARSNGAATAAGAAGSHPSPWRLAVR